MSALTNRDSNAQLTSNPASREQLKSAGIENKMPETMQKQVFEKKNMDVNDKYSGTYVSPSDAILSPATQKLAGFKQRQINKQNAKTSTSRMLFGRTPSNCSSGFDTVADSVEK